MQCKNVTKFTIFQIRSWSVQCANMTDRNSRALSALFLLLLVSTAAAQKKKKPIIAALEAKWSQTSFVLEVKDSSVCQNSKD